jgi:hypothetical protein
MALQCSKASVAKTRRRHLNQALRVVLGNWSDRYDIDTDLVALVKLATPLRLAADGSA